MTDISRKGLRVVEDCLKGVKMDVDHPDDERSIDDAINALRALRDALDEAESQRLFLWTLLDHIDTLDDACRDRDAVFRWKARNTQKKRFEISSSDGYSVSFHKPQEDVSDE